MCSNFTLLRDLREAQKLQPETVNKKAKNSKCKWIIKINDNENHSNEKGKNVGTMTYI